MPVQLGLGNTSGVQRQVTRGEDGVQAGGLVQGGAAGPGVPLYTYCSKIPTREFPFSSSINKDYSCLKAMCLYLFGMRKLPLSCPILELAGMVPE